MSFLSVSVCSSPGGPSIQMAFEMKFQSNPYNSNCLILPRDLRIWLQHFQLAIQSIWYLSIQQFTLETILLILRESIHVHRSWEWDTFSQIVSPLHGHVEATIQCSQPATRVTSA